MTLEERFWSKVDKSGGADACWPWTASLDAGYGNFGISSGRMIGAHRMSWELTHGPIHNRMFVCHKCDNPPCVNPAHLFLGTHQDNIADAKAKGRMAFGERSGKSKLTNDVVRTIRLLYFAERRSQREIGSHFGVSHTAVSAICRRHTWRSV